MTKKTDGSDDPNAAWAGGLEEVKKSTDKNIKTLGESIEKMISNVFTQGLEAKAREALIL